MANISQGIDKCLFLGNIDSLRDWGHARDYVRMQWLMLQQDVAEDYVIATGVQYSVREFVRWTAEELGIKIRFEGAGVDEIAVVEEIVGNDVSSLSVGDVIMRIDPKYYRPAEVDTLGDPSKAKLGLAGSLKYP